MVVAREFQPAIIFIDEVERVWTAKGKKKKGRGRKSKKKTDMELPSRIRVCLTKWKSKFITEDVRITIIGCTN